MPTAALRGLRVLHVGHFDPEYSRNRIVRKALERAGATVVTATDTRGFAHRAPALAKAVHDTPADLVLVGFPGHADVPVVRLAATRRRTPVVLDAFVALTESAEDRRGPDLPLSVRARVVIEDRTACRLAHAVVLDTDAHADYFARELGVPRRKLRRVWVGADDDVVRPTPLPDGGFRVFVYASFIPLHGLEHVVRAAHELERAGDPVPIEIMGDGDTAPDVRALATELGVTSIAFRGRRPFTEVVDAMVASHVCLGIFGTGPKAQRVVPNKVFDALAAARPVVTADTPAAREALTDRAHALLCPPGAPDAIAAALRELRDDAGLRTRLAAGGHEHFRRRFSIDAISSDLAAVVLEHVDAPGEDPD